MEHGYIIRTQIITVFYDTFSLYNSEFVEKEISTLVETVYLFVNFLEDQQKSTR